MATQAIKLLVGNTEERIALGVSLAEYNYGIQVLVDGYGCMAGRVGTDGIILLEKDFDTGRLKLYIWGDITNDEPTHVIDLEGASEDYREVDSE